MQSVRSLGPVGRLACRKCSNPLFVVGVPINGINEDFVHCRFCQTTIRPSENEIIDSFLEGNNRYLVSYYKIERKNIAERLLEED